jgi:hypothetical protein
MPMVAPATIGIPVVGDGPTESLLRCVGTVPTTSKVAQKEQKNPRNLRVQIPVSEGGRRIRIIGQVLDS